MILRGYFLCRTKPKDKEIDAVNAAALSGKLLQMAKVRSTMRTEILLMFIHPASAGQGLNLQASGPCVPTSCHSEITAREGGRWGR